MLGRLLKKALKRSRPKNSTQTRTDAPIEIRMTLQESIQTLTHIMGNSTDFMVRKISGREDLPEIAICYIEGLVDTNLLNRILESWLTVTLEADQMPGIESLLNKILPAGPIS